MSDTHLSKFYALTCTGLVCLFLFKSDLVGKEFIEVVINFSSQDLSRSRRERLSDVTQCETIDD